MKKEMKKHILKPPVAKDVVLRPGTHDKREVTYCGMTYATWFEESKYLKDGCDECDECALGFLGSLSK